MGAGVTRGVAEGAKDDEVEEEGWVLSPLVEGIYPCDGAASLFPQNARTNEWASGNVAVAKMPRWPLFFVPGLTRCDDAADPSRGPTSAGLAGLNRVRDVSSSVHVLRCIVLTNCSISRGLRSNISVVYARLLSELCSSCEETGRFRSIERMISDTDCGYSLTSSAFDD
jgi:hypothetical protein